MLEVVAKICAMPRNHQLNNKSILQVFLETDYINKAESITKERLVNYLTENPELIQDWENYSSDKRYSPAWYFIKDQSKWIVGFSGMPGQGKKQTFDSAPEACAEFILHEIKHLEERAPR